MSNLDSSGADLVSGPISFEMSGNSAICYNLPAISEALVRVLPLQLDWSILFPETVQ